MPTEEFCKRILADPRSIGKPMEWKDMSPMERRIHMARLNREPASFGEE